MSIPGRNTIEGNDYIIAGGFISFEKSWNTNVETVAHVRRLKDLSFCLGEMKIFRRMRQDELLKSK
jgi:hypothetical protein